MTRPFIDTERELRDRAYRLLKTHGVEYQIAPELAACQSGPSIPCTYCNISNVYIQDSDGTLSIWWVVSGS